MQVAILERRELWLEKSTDENYEKLRDVQQDLAIANNLLEQYTQFIEIGIKKLEATDVLQKVFDHTADDQELFSASQLLVDSIKACLERTNNNDKEVTATLDHLLQLLMRRLLPLAS